LEVKMAGYLEPVRLSPSQIESLERKASLGLACRFFDVNVNIRSDSRTVVDFFEQMYRHFIVASLPDNGTRHSYFVLSSDASAHGPVLIWDGNRTCSLLDGDGLFDSADIIIFGSLLRKITSHLLIHGAVLASKTGAIVLSGMSGSGKTTLALELTRRGLLFSSDEIGAISRATHLIHPFPRALGTRESTLGLLKTIDFKEGRLHHTTSGKQKWLVDIEDVFPNRSAGICHGKCLLLLETMLSSNGRPEDRHHSVRIALKKEDHELVEQLSRIDGVEHVSSDREDAFPSAYFRVRKERSVQSAFLKLCGRHDKVILYKVKVVGRAPDPHQDPKVFPISKIDAALGLLGNLQNMAINDGWLSRKYGGNPSQVLYELADAISEMDCYRLLVGDLKKTADLIFDLVN
jgi:hypothetical protein